MSSDKIDSTEVGGFWDKLFYLIKLITGDVKVSTKGTLQNQIDTMSTKVDDCFQNVSDGKKAVASALADKGVPTAQDAEFATMAANVRKIKTNPTLQTKTVTLDASNTTQTLTPDSGYDGLSQVKASITTQTKSVNLSTSEQVVKPDSGKVLSQVTVPAVTGSAGLKDVVTGKTFNSATAGIGKTGTLPDKRGTTVDAATVNQDDNYTYFTVPTEAVYDAKSKLRTLSSNLGRGNLNLLNYINNAVYKNCSAYGNSIGKAFGISSGTLVSSQTTYNDYAELTLITPWKIKEGDNLYVYGQYGASGGQGCRLGFIDENNAYTEIASGFTNGGLSEFYKFFIPLDNYKGKTIKKIKLSIFPINASVWVKLTGLSLCNKFD